MCKFLIQSDYRHGRVFFIPSDRHSIVDGKEYLTFLQQLKKTLFEKPKFKNSNPIFYINIITIKLKKCGLLNSIRLDYFTNNVTKTKKAIREFLDINKNLTIPSPELFIEDASRNIKEKPTDPQNSSPSKKEYLDSCRPLCWLTCIGLDLLEYRDFSQLRMKMCIYRRSYIPNFIPAKEVSKLYLEPIFKYSNFFKRMKLFNVQQLWEKLDYDPRINHHLVNLLLLDSSSES